MRLSTGTRTRTGVLFFCILLVAVVTSGELCAFQRETVHEVKPFAIKPLKKERKGSTLLRVMSLNIAHGAINRFGLVPFLRHKKTIQSRLLHTAKVLMREKPDILGVQEADGPSWWSGRFHHVHFLAKKAGYPYSMLGIHVKTKRKRYGTGLISLLPMKNTISYQFEPKGMFKKGFVISTFAWPGYPSVLVDTISLHLHPSKASTQHSQVMEVISYIKKRGRPAIVMGDFNCQWYPATSAIRLLAKHLKMTTFNPYTPYLYTHLFPKKRRLDWVFVSPSLKVVTHRILKDRLSDHSAVVVDIRSEAVELLAKKAKIEAKAKLKAVLQMAAATSNKKAKKSAVKKVVGKSSNGKKGEVIIEVAAPTSTKIPEPIFEVMNPATRKKTKPASRPTSKSVSKPASRPTSKPVSKPASRSLAH